MQISPNQLTIRQLFSTTNEQFSVPAYQRRYAWSQKQLGELYDDIRLLNENENHLLGSIVFLTDTHSVGINCLEVVDGQQRITTISILLYALKRRFEELNDQIASEIVQMMSCMDIKKKCYNKILLGDLDNPDYEKVIMQSDLDKIKNKHILEAYNFFLEKLPSDSEYLNEFYYKLTTNAVIIRLDVSFAKDAYRLFESINNRGLRLSATDIIKNFILGNAAMVSEDTLIKVRDYWKSLIVNLDGIMSDNFFRQYLSGILQRKIPVSKLIDEFKKYYCAKVIEAERLASYVIYSKETEEEDEDQLLDDSVIDVESERTIKNEIQSEDENGDENKSETSKEIRRISIVEFVKELSELSEIYQKIIKQKFADAKINNHLFNLHRIKSQPSFTFLLNLFQRNMSTGDTIKILKMIETFMLRRHICEYRTSELDDIFPKLVGLSNVDFINKVKNELLQYYPVDKAFEEKFLNYSFKGNIDRAKYVLELIEYKIINHQGEYYLSRGNELHLEHIIPQKINTKRSKKEFGNWEHYLGNDAAARHKKYVWRIGNLSLLGQKLNIVASNNPYLAKKREYKKSNIQLNKDLVGNYSRFKFKEVEKRSSELKDHALKIWKL